MFAKGTLLFSGSTRLTFSLLKSPLRMAEVGTVACRVAPVRYCMSSKVAKKNVRFRMILPPRLPPKSFAVFCGLETEPNAVASNARFCK